VNHEELREGLGAYALEALSPQERDEVAAHLETCADCRAEFEVLRPAVDALARAVTPVSPPPSLRAQLLDAVRADSTTEADRPTWRLRLSLPRLGRLAPVAAAGLVVVGVALGYLAAGLSEGTRRVAAQVDAARLPEAGGSMMMPVDGDPVLTLHGMPADGGASRVYQLWVRRDGEVVPDSVFEVRADGSAAAAVTEELDEGDLVLVTREPRGGSHTPSEQPVVTVDTS
jgi:anti-sigma-K factor RskA